jgi:transposase
LARDGKLDVRFDGSSGGMVSRLEVIEGPTGRRRRTKAERARIAAESLVPGVAVAEVARRHGTTRWQVYSWRRQLREGRLALPEGVACLPMFAEVVVEGAAPGVACRPGGSDLAIEVAGMVIRAGSEIAEEHLVRVIRAARRAAT